MAKPGLPHRVLRTAVPILVSFLAPGRAVALQQAPASPLEIAVKPKAEPEPRRKLPQSPDELYREIMSEDRQTKAAGLSGLLGKDVSSDDIYDPQPPRASIQAVQLDEDPDLEYIITLTDQMYEDCAIVADKSPDGWYAVGRTCEDSGWVPDDSGPMVEVRRAFVILRSFGHGTDGLQETYVGVYRMWKGRLYRTFEHVEKLHASQLAEPGKPRPDIDTSARIIFHDLASHPEIEVRAKETTTQVYNNTGEPLPPPTTTNSCDGYEWVPATFSFERTDNATKAFCK